MSGIGEFGRGETDMTAQDDERWFAVDGLCSVYRSLEGVNVFANFADILNMPP